MLISYFGLLPALSSVVCLLAFAFLAPTHRQPTRRPCSTLLIFPGPPSSPAPHFLRSSGLPPPTTAVLYYLLILYGAILRFLRLPRREQGLSALGGRKGVCNVFSFMGKCNEVRNMHWKKTYTGSDFSRTLPKPSPCLFLLFSSKFAFQLPTHAVFHLCPLLDGSLCSHEKKRPQKKGQK